VKTNKETGLQMKTFIEAFADTINLPPAKAVEQWAGFSRQLSDQERERIERGGESEGKRMGEDFNRLYPKEEAQ